MFNRLGDNIENPWAPRPFFWTKILFTCTVQWRLELRLLPPPTFLHFSSFFRLFSFCFAGFCGFVLGLLCVSGFKSSVELLVHCGQSGSYSGADLHAHRARHRTELRMACMREGEIRVLWPKSSGHRQAYPLTLCGRVPPCSAVALTSHHIWSWQDGHVAITRWWQFCLFVLCSTGSCVFVWCFF